APASARAPRGSAGRWRRRHYVYPYPHVDALIPLMAEGFESGRILPYLDIPFQHASRDVLRAMRRPADQEKTLDRIAAWRREIPELALRSTFIVGFPGETERDVEILLEWLEEAQLDRVGCFQYEDVAGAAANDLPNHVAPELTQERWERFMAKAREISEAKMRAKLGRTLAVIVDEVDEDGATARSMADAPEIDGTVFIDTDFDGLRPGDIVSVAIEEAEAYDLWGRRVGGPDRA
ncbi:MAG: radical SAM protein, partial [Pseudomonadota bacterium]